MTANELLVGRIEQYLKAEDAWSVNPREYQHNRLLREAADALAHPGDTISASGNRVRLHGSLDNVLDLVCHRDDSVPEGTIELRDGFEGRVLGRIINVGHE